MKIIILEDEKQVAEKIESLIKTYFDNRNKQVEITWFSDAFSLLENYSSDVSVLFMDIQMKMMSGMEAAQKIRKIDPYVLIVFVTNLAQYAVEGYSVNAFDFILKPVDYAGFEMKLNRIVHELEHRSVDKFINLKLKNGIIRLAISDISYIEVSGHDVIYHTKDEEYICRQTLKNVAKELESDYFVLCSNSCLVNLAYVKKVYKSIILTTGEELFISQGKRKQFMMELAKYMGGTI